MIKIKSLVNLPFFYSTHSLGDLSSHTFSSFFGNWWLSYILPDSMSYLYFKSYIQSSIGHFHVDVPWSHKGSLSKTASIGFSPKLALMDFFFFLPWWLGPLPTQSSPIAWSHPWYLLLSQLMTESSHCSLVPSSFLFISLPLPLFWQKALNVFFCLGALPCSSAVCTLHKGTWLRGRVNAGIEITLSPWVLHPGSVVSLHRISFF